MKDEAENLWREIGMAMVFRAHAASGCSAAGCEIAARGQPGADDPADRRLTLYHNKNEDRREFFIPWDGSGDWFYQIVEWLKSFHPTPPGVQSNLT